MFVLLPKKKKKIIIVLCSYFLFFSFVLVYCFPSCLFLLRPPTQSAQLLTDHVSFSLPFFYLFTFTQRTRKLKFIHVILIVGYHNRYILSHLRPTSSSTTITTTTKNSNIILCASARTRVHTYTHIHLICMFGNVML